jgi:hypothetical protein
VRWLIRPKNRQAFGRRRWLLGLPIAVAICSLAFVVPATSAAKEQVKVSVALEPPSCELSVTATWTPVSGQRYVQVIGADKQSGTLIITSLTSISPSETSFTRADPGIFSPLPTGRHAVKATVFVLDFALNPIISGKGNTSAACGVLF